MSGGVKIKRIAAAMVALSLISIVLLTIFYGVLPYYLLLDRNVAQHFG